VTDEERDATLNLLANTAKERDAALAKCETFRLELERTAHELDEVGREHDAARAKVEFLEPFRIEVFHLWARTGLNEDDPNHVWNCELVETLGLLLDLCAEREREWHLKAREGKG
jgi:hypothetical protein